MPTSPLDTTAMRGDGGRQRGDVVRELTERLNRLQTDDIIHATIDDVRGFRDACAVLRDALAEEVSRRRQDAMGKR